MWILIIVVVIVIVLFLSRGGRRRYTEEEMLEMSKEECGKLVSELGAISQISDIRQRKIEYNRVRNNVIRRRREPIGIMLEAAFNTFTNVDRHLVDAIEAND